MSRLCQSLLFDRRGRPSAQLATLSFEFDNGHVVPEHLHPEAQLVFASQGVMTVRTNQGVWVVPPLRAVWIPAKTPHSIVMSGTVSMRTLYFLPEFASVLPRSCSVLHISPLLKELILHACKFPRLNMKVAAQRRLIEIILDQLEAADSIPLQLPHPVDLRALRIVEVLLTDPSESKTLASLCRNCGASRRTIERIFVAETKMTFSRWRQQLRLLHALRLLASGEKVTAAALAAGYGSTSAFIAMFRKQLGRTPGRYFAHRDLSVPQRAVGR